MQNILDICSRLLSEIAALCLLVLLLGVTVNVVSRTFLDRDIPGVLEGGELVLTISVFLGMAWTFRTGNHVQVDLITERLPKLAQKICAVIAHAALLTLLLWMTVETWSSAMASVQSGEYSFGTIQFPMWPARLAIPIGSAAFALAVLGSLIKQLIDFERADTSADQIPPSY